MNNILFRASRIGMLMSDPRSKKEIISETAKAYLVEVFVEKKYGREKDLQNKYLEKGITMEGAAVALYNSVNFKELRKNELRISNEYIIGTPDLFEGNILTEAKRIIDLKCSFDIFTFFKAKFSPINKMYYWQMQAYMALTGAKTATLAYCLVNTPDKILLQEIKRQQWEALSEGELSKELRDSIIRLSRYDDIPETDRLYEIDIPRDDAAIEVMYQRVQDARLWITNNLLKQKKHHELPINNKMR